MKDSVLDVKQIALSGTDTVTYVLPTSGPLPQSVTVGLDVKYAAVAATSGISAAFSVSKDGGTTWVAAVESALVVAPAATVLGHGEKKIVISGPNKLETTPITAIKVVATNLDATNAAAVAISVEPSNYI